MDAFATEFRARARLSQTRQPTAWIDTPGAIASDKGP